MPIGIVTSDNHQSAILKVIGIGGGGGNAINNMIESDLKGVEFIAANTDKQALDYNQATVKIQVGSETTRGLGAGADPEVGYKSVEESEDQIKKALDGSDMVFITAGMGGGTGTGGAPMIAQIARSMDALVVAIVTKPFSWEGKKRAKVADEWINKLRKEVDALIVIPNQRLLEIIDKNTKFDEAFKKVDDVLYNATRGISDIVNNHGYINVDFADVKTVMKGMGDALMGIGKASGDNRAVEATHNALNSPLLNGIKIKGAKGVLINISGSNVGMHEMSQVNEIIEEEAGEDANLITGIVNTDVESDEIMVSVVATGFDVDEKDSEPQQPKETRNLFHDDNVQPRKPAVLFSKNANKKLVNTPTSSETPAANISPVPRGPQSLREYDGPAWQRRGANIHGLVTNGVNKDKN